MRSAYPGRRWMHPFSHRSTSRIVDHGVRRGVLANHQSIELFLQYCSWRLQWFGHPWTSYYYGFCGQSQIESETNNRKRKTFRPLYSFFLVSVRGKMTNQNFPPLSHSISRSSDLTNNGYLVPRILACERALPKLNRNK